MHLDHLTPRARGGTDDASNLVAACASCNSTRRHMPLATWQRYAAEKLGVVFSARRVRAQARRVPVAPRRASLRERGGRDAAAEVLLHEVDVDEDA